MTASGASASSAPPPQRKATAVPPPVEMDCHIPSRHRSSSTHEYLQSCHGKQQGSPRFGGLLGDDGEECDAGVESSSGAATTLTIGKNTGARVAVELHATQEESAKRAPRRWRGVLTTPRNDSNCVPPAAEAVERVFSSRTPACPSGRSPIVSTRLCSAATPTRPNVPPRAHAIALRGSHKSEIRRYERLCLGR
jgi:hypothetical protein